MNYSLPRFSFQYFFFTHPPTEKKKRWGGGAVFDDNRATSRQSESGVCFYHLRRKCSVFVRTRLERKVWRRQCFSRSSESAQHPTQRILCILNFFFFSFFFFFFFFPLFFFWICISSVYSHLLFFFIFFFGTSVKGVCIVRRVGDATEFFFLDAPKRLCKFVFSSLGFFFKIIYYSLLGFFLLLFAGRAINPRKTKRAFAFWSTLMMKKLPCSVSCVCGYVFLAVLYIIHDWADKNNFEKEFRMAKQQSV